VAIVDHAKQAYWTTLREARRLSRRISNKQKPIILKSRGICPICRVQTQFVARDPWLRDHLLCSGCQSIPRERALMLVLERFFPNWQALTIHESSPGDRGASTRLAREAPCYIASQFYPDKAPGTMVGKVRSENLEALSFADESIDVHITQDVLEHVFRPADVFREIARTLKPGGAHVFTVPLVNKASATTRRAALNDDGAVVHLEPPMFHGNPISADGSLVTMDWGFDIAQQIFQACGLYTQMICIDDLSRGIRAEHIEVLVTMKSNAPVSAIGAA